MKRSFTCAAVIVLAMISFAGRAVAGSGDQAGTGSANSGSGTILADAGVTSGGPGGSGTRSGCTWSLVDRQYADFPFPGNVWPYADSSGVVWHVYLRACPNESTVPTAVPEVTPQDLRVLAERELKQKALPKPAVTFQPFDADKQWTYVKLPVDFRVDAAQWHEFSVTARAGPLWVTATAVPKRLVFDPGDHHTDSPPPVACAGAAPIAGYEPKFPGFCSYTYLHASSTSEFDHYHFLTSTSIEWDISWTSSTGAGGSLGGFSTTGQQQLAVAEIQAIITCTGPLPGQGGCGG